MFFDGFDIYLAGTVLGVTFKENVPDIRNTRVVDIAQELADFGIEIGTSFGPLHGRIWRIGTMGYNARKDAVLTTLKAKGAFDAVLIDAPCTGLGALRRRPESRWRKTPNDLKDLTRLQAELIESAWRQLKVGGILGYVTCSPHPAETTSIVSKLLSTHKDAELLFKSSKPAIHNASD